MLQIIKGHTTEEALNLQNIICYGEMARLNRQKHWSLKGKSAIQWIPVLYTKYIYGATEEAAPLNFISQLFAISSLTFVVSLMHLLFLKFVSNCLICLSMLQFTLDQCFCIR